MKLVFLLKYMHRLIAVYHILGAELFVIPLCQSIDIQRIRGQPVYRREVARVCKGRIERPEHLDDTHRCLRNRLGDIAARRRNCADGGDGAASFIRAEAFDNACALVKLRDTRCKVGRVAFFAWHFLKSAGHLAQSLRPTRGGVCENRDVIAHIAEILCNGDTCVDRRLACRNGHIGGVCYKNGPLHQRFAVSRVCKLRELHENVCHLIAALAAADVDNYIDVRPLCKLVLNDGLARAERAGNCRSTALCYREERVDYSLSGVHRARRHALGCIGSAYTDRPLLHQGKLMLFAFVILKHGNGLRYGEVAALDAQKLAAHVGRHHYFVQNGACFLNGTDNVAACKLIALVCGRRECPLFLAVERRNVGAAAYGRAGQLADLRQWALDTVVDILQHTRSELDGHRHARAFDLRARSEAGGLLIDLDRRAVARHIKYLAYKSVGTDTHNVGYVCVAQSLRDYKRS